MRENYWNQFMASGRIEDYLNYRLGDCSGCAAPGPDSGRAENGSQAGARPEACGKEQREPDCTYGHGAFHHANRGI